MRDYGDWNEVGSVAVAAPPMSEKDKAAEARRVTEKEDNRLRLRERLKRQLAASRVAESRVNELYAVITKLEGRKESLASDHVAACSPIQKELSLLRENQVNRILAGNDTDDDADRRIKLQEKISELNANLEKQIRDTDESITPLQIELRAVAKGMNPSLKNDLMHSASLETRIKMQVLISRTQFLRRRVDGLSEALRERQNDWLLPALQADAAMMLADAERLSSDAIAACVDE